jgi:hypothetical protein
MVQLPWYGKQGKWKTQRTREIMPLTEIKTWGRAFGLEERWTLFVSTLNLKLHEYILVEASIRTQGRGAQSLWHSSNGLCHLQKTGLLKEGVLLGIKLWAAHLLGRQVICFFFFNCMMNMWKWQDCHKREEHRAGHRAYTCNLSYSGGRDWEDQSWRSAKAKS